MENTFYCENGEVAKVSYGEAFDSPREWDNLGKLCIKFGGAEIDETPYCPELLVAWVDNMDIEEAQDFFTMNTGEWAETSEIREEFANFEKKIGVALPVYKYEHSGIAFDASGFSCPWDSGRSGVIVALKEDIKEGFGVKRISKKMKDEVEQILKNEIDTYSRWCNGQVFDVFLYDSVEDYQNGLSSDNCGGLMFKNEEDAKAGVEVEFGVKIKCTLDDYMTDQLNAA